MPLKWQFTASDGKVDLAGDIVSVPGIKLNDYAANPIWHYAHNYSQPVGMAPSTYKAGGKLKSVLELGIGVFPAAEALQVGLARGMIKACSIGFKPIDWSYNKQRDGIDFHEVSLIEISACTLPCCPGATLDGPVKSLDQSDERERARQRRNRDLELERMRVGP